ncbi:MAG: uracil-DNA glycosylase [Candidatus Nealsonbacteria bacterium]|nr:uracil-DNA glycosylase [Candidatus Nealsonbacteria bacterium]
MSENEKDNLLLAIKEEVIRCQKCSLYKTRTLPVVGQGNHSAQIMFIGEAPGANEDKTGVPFCGEAGQILNLLLVSIGVKREDVYIANILKDRPPANREPAPEEVKACAPYLLRQIAIIEPQVIATLGNHSAHFVLEYFGVPESQLGISQLRGRKFAVQDPLTKKHYTVIPLYHPAVAVYNRHRLSDLKNNFKAIKEQLKDE